MASMDTISTTGSVGLLRSPAADRNKDAILQVLRKLIPQGKAVSALEVASGTGQHVVHLAANMDNVTWQPTEYDQKSLQSIQGYIAAEPTLQRVLDPVWLDTTQPVEEWANSNLQQESFDLILCINMTHIAKWECTEGLFSGSGYYLKPEGTLVIYGPYKIHGEITPESNVQFDRMLRQQCSEWGLRDVDDLEKQAQQNGMVYEKMEDMPANNKILVYRKKS